MLSRPAPWHQGLLLLVRLAVIGLMVVACAYLARRVTTNLLLLLLAGGSGLVLIGHPQWGLLAWIPVSMLVPIAFSTGTNTEVPISLLLLAALLAIWLLDMLRRRDLRLAPCPANAPLLALLVVAVLTTIVGNALWNPMVAVKANFPIVQLAQWSVLAFSAGAFWLTANLLRDVRWLRWMVGIFLGLGAIYIILRVALGNAAIIASIFVPKAMGSLFWIWLVAMAGGQALFNRQLGKPMRLAMVALVGATLYVAWYLGRSWVAGWAPPLVAVLLLVWLRSPRWGALVTGSLALIVWLDFPAFYASTIGAALESGSFLRLDAWRGIIQLVGGHWPMGLGLAAYTFYWSAILRTWTWSPTNVVVVAPTERVPAHNNYIDIYAQMGVLGLIVFLWLVSALGRQAWQLRTRVPEGFERGYVYGCLCGLVGSLAAAFLSDWLLPFVYNQGLQGTRASLLGWAFLGGLVVIAQAARARRVEAVVD